MNLWQFVVRRLLLLIPVFLGVTLITFLLVNSSGNPCTIYFNEKMTQEQLDRTIAKYGCDQPVWTRYGLYMNNLVHGDLGTSAASNRPVIDDIALFFPATLELTSAAMFLAVLLAVPLGVVSATKKDTLPDHLGRAFALSGVSIPIFWFALLLQLLMFSMDRAGYPSLPISGAYSVTLIHEHPFLDTPSLQPTHLLILDSLILGDFTAFLDLAAHIILPAIALAYTSMAIVTRMMRSSMLEVLRQDFVLSARAKGVPERLVRKRHARANALIPTVTVIGLAFGGLLAGAVLTESVFAWPGVGRWSTNSILARDSVAIMGFSIVISVVYVLANLVVDIVYAYLDPRIRLE